MMKEVGIVYALPPEPLVEADTRFFEGAGVRIGVEYRHLDGARVAEMYSSNPEYAKQYEAVQAAHDGAIVDDGVSLHVLGPDGHEYLRFDCFEGEPHYHYVHPRPEGEDPHNHWIPLDDIANGEPLAWALARLRTRLPEMLIEAEGETVAAGVDRAAVAGLIDEVEAYAREVSGAAA